MSRTYKEFIEDIKNIVNNYVGKVDEDAYQHITNDIKKYLNSYTPKIPAEYEARPGVVAVNLPEGETDRINSMYVITYHIVFKTDERSTKGLVTGRVLRVEVETGLPDDFLDVDIYELPQIVHYILAKQCRNYYMIELKKLRQKLDECQKIIENYDKSIVNESLPIIDILMKATAEKSTEEQKRIIDKYVFI